MFINFLTIICPEKNEIKSPLAVNTMDWRAAAIEAKPCFKENEDVGDASIGQLCALSKRNFKPIDDSKLQLPYWFTKLCPQDDYNKESEIFSLRADRLTHQMIDTIKMMGLKYSNESGCKYEVVYDAIHKWGILVPGRPRKVKNIRTKPSFKFPFA